MESTSIQEHERLNLRVLTYATEQGRTSVSAIASSSNYATFEKNDHLLWEWNYRATVVVLMLLYNK